MELSTQFNVHLTNNPAAAYVGLARYAFEQGFSTVWLNENARYRSLFTLLAAIAAQVPVTVGTATIVPYFNHPLTLASTLGTLSEVAGGRAIKVGAAIGDLGQTAPYVAFTNRLAMLEETVQFQRRALTGELVPFADFPTLADYFKLNPAGTFKLAFQPPGPLPFYGGSLGPKSLQLTGRVMDGVVFPGQFLAFYRSGRLPELMQRLHDAAEGAVRPRPRCAAIVNISMAEDRQTARRFAQPQVAHSVISIRTAGLSDDELQRLGVEPERIDRLSALFARGATIEEAAAVVSNPMVDAYYLAGTPDEVVPRAIETARDLHANGVDEVIFAKLGADYRFTLDALARDVLPELRRTSG